MHAFLMTSQYVAFSIRQRVSQMRFPWSFAEIEFLEKKGNFFIFPTIVRRLVFIIQNGWCPGFENISKHGKSPIITTIATDAKRPSSVTLEPLWLNGESRRKRRWGNGFQLSDSNLTVCPSLVKKCQVRATNQTEIYEMLWADGLNEPWFFSTFFILYCLSLMGGAI